MFWELDLTTEEVADKYVNWSTWADDHDFSGWQSELEPH